MDDEDEFSCILCKETDSSQNLQKVKAGIKTLISNCEYLEKYAEHSCLLEAEGQIETIPVYVHNCCRKQLINDVRKRKLQVRGEDPCELPSKRRKSSCRQTEIAFDWKKHCFVCSGICDEFSDNWSLCDVKRKDNPESTRNKILELVANKTDDLSLNVYTRVSHCSDLPAVEARYHIACRKKLDISSIASPSGSSRGRPTNAIQTDNFIKLCDWFEKECELYTIYELYEQMKILADDPNDPSQVYADARYLKRKLKERYGDKVIFTDMQGKIDVVCLKETASTILKDTWYTNRSTNVESESKRIVQTAAKLILTELKSTMFDTTTYPTNEMIKDIDYNKEWLPGLLRTLVESLINNTLRQASIGQSIVYAARPRSALPPILFGSAIELDHVFGSRWLLTEQNQLGFSLSPDEVVRYKQSVVVNESPNDLLNLLQGSFGQWSADNVDHNVRTLDGKGTLHAMGIIVSTTGGDANNLQTHLPLIPREKRRTAGEAITGQSIPIEYYQPKDTSCLSKLTFNSLKDHTRNYQKSHDIYLDLLWHASYFNFNQNKSQQRPGWNGYMQNISKGSYPGKSVVTMLPIIDLDPTDMNCIHSTLKFICKQAIVLNIETPVVTFDQPLWFKANEIVQTLDLKIVLILGGFHMMMSFAGSIGTLMSGSGLDAALETSYGPNSVKHMLTGKSIAMFLRANFLTESALMLKIMSLFFDDTNQSTTEHTIEEDHSGFTDEENLNEEERSQEDWQQAILSSNDDLRKLSFEETGCIKKLLDDVEENYNKALENLSNSTEFNLLRELVAKAKQQLQQSSRTAKLWINYLNYIQIVKNFIRAERTGNWQLHLQSVKEMLNLFAATGHIHYAKSARMYLQKMMSLETDFPWVHNKFVNEGYHTVRRSSRFWAGLWTDLTIEQVMMRSIKSRGGLTRGRGVTESVRTLWINTTHRVSGIHEAMTDLTGSKHRTSEQHAEMSVSRRKKDNETLQQLQAWFAINNPFDISCPELRSLSTGLVATKDDNINCDEAEKIGQAIQTTLDGAQFFNCTIKRKDQIRTLSCLQNSVKIGEDTVVVKPEVLFNRLTLLVQKEKERTQYFEHELTPEPAALFKNGKIRKPAKNVLRNHLLQCEGKSESPEIEVVVIDGGDLLFHTSWNSKNTYQEILQKYSKYIKDNFNQGNIIVVFDGNDDVNSTKGEEHSRRGKGSSASVNVKNLESKSTCNKQAFMKNRHNKMQLINLLKAFLVKMGISVRQSYGDADVMICKTALTLAAEGKTVQVSGKDTDLLVVLIHHWREGMKLFFRTPFKLDKQPRSREKVMWWNIGDIVALNPNLQNYLLFAHVWGGCDTTSATYQQGKLKVLKLLSSQTIQNVAMKFYNDSTPAEIGKIGCSIMLRMYGGKDSESLASLRHLRWYQATMINSKELEPASLPPTERATYFHSLRVYLEMAKAIKLDIDCGLDPCNWGWQRSGDILKPVKTDLPPAPDFLLHVIRCNCKTSSKNTCGSMLCTCKKNGLRCMPACGDCRGVACENMVEEGSITPMNDDEDDGNIFDKLFEF